VTAFAVETALSKDAPRMPDLPTFESERRFALFAAAAGLSRTAVSGRRSNSFLARMLEGSSPRNGLLPLTDYRLAALKFLRRDAACWVERFEAEDQLSGRTERSGWGR
jgi:hypothetical protein